MKRLLRLSVCFILVLALLIPLPGTAFAATTEDSWVYAYIDDELDMPEPLFTIDFFVMLFGEDWHYIAFGRAFVFAYDDLSDEYLRGINLLGNDNEYFLFNAHGDVVRYGSKEYKYDAFGVEENIDPNDGNVWRYCAEYWDRETGSYYLRARYYNPANGRFTSEDPIRDGLNFYTYCGGNPIRFVDPSGLRPDRDYDDDKYCKTFNVNGYLVSGGFKTQAEAEAWFYAQKDKDKANSILDKWDTGQVSKVDKDWLNRYMEQQMFVALIYAEAGGESKIYWEIAAYTIMNRYYNPQDVFEDVKSVTDVMTQKYQYTGYGVPNYNIAMKYLLNRDGSNTVIESIISTVMPIYNGTAQDITDGAQWYFSPQHMVPKDSIPKYAQDPKYTEVFIPNVVANIMRVYKR